MPHQKKKAVHHCATHRKVPATGRCVVCKTWVCRQCSQKVSNQLFCLHCAPKKLLPEVSGPSPTTPAEPSPPQMPQRYSMRSLVLLAGITLALCGIVFGVLTLRYAADVSAQLGELKEKRSDLLEQIKARNREIAALQRTTDSLKGLVDSSSPKKKTTFALRSDCFVPSPVNGLPVSFDNGSTEKRLVCLTFDGSSFSNAAPDILDTLSSRGVKATFFLSGDFIRKFHEVVLRIARDGHETGNHTFHHPHLTSYAQDQTQSLLPSVNDAFISHELAATDSLYRAATGTALMPLWRAPYGEFNRVICLWAQHAGFLHVGWRQGRTWRQNLDSNDWIPDEETRGYHSPQEVYDKIVSLASGPGTGISGGIILMHLGTVRTQKDKQVHLMLGKLIDTLRSLNYRLVPVSEMLRESGVDVNLLKRS
jgi:peptidoglycan/xylan/chitin deacetylase (PgdA/CDA1 family)